MNAKHEQEQIKELESLEIIESSEMKVGNAFHAFKFSIGNVSSEEVEKKDE
jgi:hypothetical protein